MLALLLASVPRATAACATSLDCSLNGACSSSSVCECHDSWRGQHCERLDVQPTAPSLTAQRAYPPANGTASWGGNAVYDSQTKLWHLFVSPVAHSCGMDCWNTQQYIQHAVSKAVAGPYVDAPGGGVVQPLMSTNPQAAVAPNGSVIVAHIGRGQPLPQPALQVWTNCSGGVTPCCHGPSASAAAAAAEIAAASAAPPPPGPSPGCTNAGKPCTIMWPSADTGFLAGDSFDGPWTKHMSTFHTPPSPSVRPWPFAVGTGMPSFDNPSPLMLKNGTLLMMHVLRIAQAGANTANFAAIARNDNWADDKGWRPIAGEDFARGMITTNTPFRGAGCNASTGVVVDGHRFRCPAVSEDPFFWQDARGNFHAIFHYDGATHAFSENAIDWWISPSYAYTPVVQHTDGSSTQYASRERPKLSLDPQTLAPVAILSAVRAPWLDSRCGARKPPWNVHAPFCDASFTHVQLVGRGS